MDYASRLKERPAAWRVPALITALALLLMLYLTSFSSGADGESDVEAYRVTWDLSRPGNYTLNGTVLENGSVSLATVEGTLTVKTQALENGEFDNTTWNPEDGVELNQSGSYKCLNINTNWAYSGSVFRNKEPFQTFKFDSKKMVTDVWFAAGKSSHYVNHDLYVSIQNEGGKVLAQEKIPYYRFDSWPKWQHIHADCTLEANTTYRLLFSANVTNGYYFVIVDSKDVYDNGSYFYNFTDDQDPPGDTGLDMELEIYAKTFRGSGSYTSPVIDAGTRVFWNNLTWKGDDFPGKTSVSFQARSGSSEDPGAGTFSEWRDCGDLGTPDLPPSRYVQFRAVFTSEEVNMTSSIREVGFGYSKYVARGELELPGAVMYRNGTWSNFSLEAELNDQTVECFYSIDSGKSWADVSNIELNGNISSDRIRFFVLINTQDTSRSPAIHRLGIDFTPFPEVSEPEEDDTEPVNDTLDENTTLPDNTTVPEEFPDNNTALEDLNETLPDTENPVDDGPPEAEPPETEDPPVILPDPVDEFTEHIDLPTGDDEGDADFEERFDPEPQDQAPQVVPKETSPPGVIPTPAEKPVAYATAGTATVSIGLVSAFLFTENGKYLAIKLSFLLAIPLYTKLSKKNVLDHLQRKQIYKYIEANPGTTYSQIMKELDITNGVLVHHLRTLEREHLIKSANDGVYYRRFYPIDVKVKKKEIENLSWFQLGIYNHVKKNPGMTPKELAKEMKKSKQVINYHVKLMKDAGLLDAEKDGKQTKLFALEARDDFEGVREITPRSSVRIVTEDMATSK